jgi:GxxExxY protein
MDAEQVRMNGITEKILGCAFKVSNTLGCGFLEKVYHNAPAHELRKAGLKVELKKPIKVYYDGVEVGDYEADLLVAESVLIELKAVKALDEVHQAQCMNYLRATGRTICLLLNFGTSKLQIKRIVLDF